MAQVPGAGSGNRLAACPAPRNRAQPSGATPSEAQQPLQSAITIPAVRCVKATRSSKSLCRQFGKSAFASFHTSRKGFSSRLLIYRNQFVSSSASLSGGPPIGAMNWARHFREISACAQQDLSGQEEKTCFAIIALAPGVVEFRFCTFLSARFRLHRLLLMFLAGKRGGRSSKVLALFDRKQLHEIQ